MANLRRHKKEGTFKKNVTNISGIYSKGDERNERSITIYAYKYYKSHRKSIDNIINKQREKYPGRWQNRSNKDIFVEQVEDLLQGQASFGKKTTLNAKVKGLLNEMQGMDPKIDEIKREASFREEAGFGDLRKLNKKMTGQEITYDGPNNIVGYFDIAGSDYVIIHRLDYTFSSDSPEDVYEYETRTNAGLAVNE